MCSPSFTNYTTHTAEICQLKEMLPRGSESITMRITVLILTSRRTIENISNKSFGLVC